MIKKIVSKTRRIEVMSHLADLSDRDLQLNEWADPNYLHAFWDNFKYAFELFVEDLQLDENPQDLIGFALYDQKELEYVINVKDAIEKVINVVGFRKKDFDYLDCPYWNEVIQSAQTAYQALDRRTPYESLFF